MPIVVCCVNRPAYINFTKRVQIASVMKKILEQQSADYALQPIDCIQVLHNCLVFTGSCRRAAAYPVVRKHDQEWFVAQLDQFGATSEDALFSMSLVAEPREG